MWRHRYKRPDVRVNRCGKQAVGKTGRNGDRQGREAVGGEAGGRGREQGHRGEEGAALAHEASVQRGTDASPANTASPGMACLLSEHMPQ